MRMIVHIEKCVSGTIGLQRFYSLRNENSEFHYFHRRRSDWNSGGTHGGTNYKSPAVEAKITFSYIECK